MKITLRKWEMKDAFALANLIDNMDQSYLRSTFPTPYPLEDAVLYISNANNKEDVGKGLFRAICLEDEIIGNITFMTNEEMDEGCFAYYLRHDQEGKGYMSQALPKMLDEVNSRYKLEVLAAYIYLENVASRRVLEKCGFQLVRTFGYVSRDNYAGKSQAGKFVLQK